MAARDGEYNDIVKSLIISLSFFLESFCTALHNPEEATIDIVLSHKR